MSELARSPDPILDLGSWRQLTLSALVKLLAFAFARVNSDSAVIPIRLTSESRSALLSLYRMRVFTLATSSGFRNDAFLNQDELARLERLTVVTPDRRTCMPLHRVAEAGQRRDEFYAACAHFLTAMQRLFADVLPLSGLSDLEIRTLYRPSKELIENIHLHSGSWGFGGARVGSAGIEISYADIGRGIRSALCENVRFRERPDISCSDVNAIRQAFSWGATGRAGEGRGTGLFETRRFVLERRGAIECRSGTARIVYTKHRPVEETELTFVPGVQISMFLPHVERGHR